MRTLHKQNQGKHTYNLCKSYLDHILKCFGKLFNAFVGCVVARLIANTFLAYFRHIRALSKSTTKFF
jgi:hypothetical protein